MRRTAGLFDATMLDHLEAAGYDRSFELLDHLDDDPVPPHPPLSHPDGVPTAIGTAPLSANELIEADPRTGLVTLPAGIRIDPGGIGKGLAADLVAIEAMATEPPGH